MEDSLKVQKVDYCSSVGSLKQNGKNQEEREEAINPQRKTRVAMRQLALFVLCYQRVL